jgi:hypothetical protein
VANKIKDLGIDVDIFALDTGGYGQRAIAGNFDIEAIATTLSAPILGGTLATYSGPPPPAGINLALTGAGNQKYNRLAQLAVGTPGGQGCKYFYQLQQYILENHLALPLSAQVLYEFSKGWEFVANPFLNPVFFKKK